MPIYTLPEPREFRPPGADQLEVSGEDVMFGSGMEISAGDWRTVRGSDAAEQSVRRESCSTVGGLMRRPEWGMGATSTVFQGITRSMIDALVARVRNRMLANPRVGRFVGAEIVKLSGTRGLSLQINYEPVGVARPASVVLRGSR